MPRLNEAIKAPRHAKGNALLRLDRLDRLTKERRVLDLVLNVGQVVSMRVGEVLGDLPLEVGEAREQRRALGRVQRAEDLIVLLCVHLHDARRARGAVLLDERDRERVGTARRRQHRVAQDVARKRRLHVHRFHRGAAPPVVAAALHGAQDRLLLCAENLRVADEFHVEGALVVLVLVPHGRGEFVVCHGPCSLLAS